DPVSHTPRPQATLHAEIAVGAAISLGLISAGVEGGIAADIQFFLSDLDKDGKIRLSELAANLLANDFNPIAVFDIKGVLTFFLRAYVKINLLFTSITLPFEFARLKLLDFTITFKRPAFMAPLQGGVLTLAIGPDAHNRLQGDVTDISEAIYAKSAGAGVVKVWSPQFNRDEGNAQTFTGVTKIVADGGQGDDTIDLSRVDDSSISVVVTGGAGNDHLISSSQETDVLSGGDGDDTLDGGKSTSILRGDAGNDTLSGGALGTLRLDGGAGNDTVSGGGHAGTTFIGRGVASTDIVAATPVLDFTGRPENITFLLNSGHLLAYCGDAVAPSSAPEHTV